MANPLKGEVELPDVDGKSYVLCYPSNAIVEIETLSGGKDIGSIILEWQQSPAIGPLRLLLWGALRKHHSILSLFDVGDLIDDAGAGRMEEIGGLIGKALRFRLSGTFEGPAANEGDKPE